MDNEFVKGIVEEARRVYNSGGSCGSMSGLQEWQRNYSSRNGEIQVVNEVVKYVLRRNSCFDSRVFDFGDDLVREILEFLSGKK